MEVWDRRKLLVGALSLGCLVMVGCAKPPAKRVAFSDSLRERHRLGEAELRRLQYYISHQIVLERVAAGGTRHVDRGRLIVRGGVTIHQVVIPAGTPGWIEAPAFVGDDDRRHVVEVSFDSGAPLRFAARDPGGAYVLAAPVRKSTGSFADLFPSWGAPTRFEVPFAGEKWRVSAGADSYLQIETDALDDLRSTQRVLPGLVGPDSD